MLGYQRVPDFLRIITHNEDSSLSQYKVLPPSAFFCLLITPMDRCIHPYTLGVTKQLGTLGHQPQISGRINGLIKKRMM